MQASSGAKPNILVKKEAKIKTFDKNGEGTVRNSKIIFTYSYRFFNYLSDAP
jgi:hypothetical protein